jgi:Secretion system C-terminal sorting domain
MEPDSGIDRSYSVRVRAKNFLNVYSQPITFSLKFHTKYKLPAAVKDSACVDSSFTDNIPFSNSFYLHRDSIAWSDSHFADSLNSYATAARIFGNTHSMLVFNGADTVGYNLNDSLFIGQIGEGLQSLPIQITSYYPYRQRNEPDNVAPNINGLFDLANNANEDNLHPLGIPAYDYGCVCLSYDTLTVIGKPEVSVSYTLPDTIEQGYSTVFTTTANNPTLDYIWQFSDEGLSYNSDPLHYFYDIGPQSLALTVTDQYGCSSIIGLNDITYVNLSYIGIEQLENDFMIYPNPASDYIFINSASGTDFSVKLYNGLGQLLFTGMNANLVDLTAFAPGMYQLQIFAGGVEKTYKIIKSNSN